MNDKHRETIKRKKAIREEARRRVQAVWMCVNALCPGLPLHERKRISGKILDLTRCKPPVGTPRITPAQVASMVWENMQCIQRHCSMVLFSEPIAAELNEFFKSEHGQ